MKIVKAYGAMTFLIVSLFTCLSKNARSAEIDPVSLANGQHKSLAATAHIGPFENFPKGGVSVDGLYHLHERIRLGGKLTWFFPKAYGNVQRNAGTIELMIQGLLLDYRYVDWTLSFGLGVGLFHDDYQRVYDDVTRLAPGFTLRTGAEVRITNMIHPFVEYGASLYFANNITDTQWMEITLGLRLIF